MSARRGVQLLLCLAAVTALAGCGVSTQHAPPERGAELATHEREPPAALRARPPETVLAEGSMLDAATPLAEGPFQIANSKRVHFDTTSSRGAFADLCSGKVDVIEPGQTPTRAEQKACTRNHLDLVGPLLVASDAAVIATKNEADVGGDCLTTGQVRDIFRAGSPYTNWNQLGFFDIPLHTTGSLAEPVLDELFARRVLGNSGSLSRSELRGDFIATPGAEATRRRVVGIAGLIRARATARERRLALRTELETQRKRLVEAAVARADRRVLRQIAAVNARNRRLKIHVDAEALIRHNAEIDAAAKREAEQAANARFDARIAPRIARLTSGLLARARTPGVVGFVPFTFYEQWEEQLRPMEIWSSSPGSGAQEPNCVFPSAQTVSSGHYPLSQQLLVYTTRQAFARSTVREYLLYLIANAQSLATRAGLVPITTQQRDADLLALGVQPPESTPNASAPSLVGESHGNAPPSAEQVPVAPSGVPGVGSSTTTSPSEASGGGIGSP
jgi:phosphate transport system substrate-binding protein